MIDWFGFIVAAIVVIGGLIGFIKAESWISLLSGILFGILMLYGAFLNSSETPKPTFQLIVYVVFGVIMAIRWDSTQKLMPAGMLFVLSIVAVTVNVFQYYAFLPWIKDVANNSK